MNRNILAVILLVAAFGLYFTVTENVYTDAKTVNATNGQYINALDNASKLIAVRDQVIQSYNSLSQNDRDRLSRMVPNTVDNIRLIIDLSGVAGRHGLALQNIKADVAPDSSGAKGRSVPAPSSGAAGVGGAGSIETAAPQIMTPTLDTVTVAFSVTAPYQEFISFLRDLEANLRIMDISKLEMTSADSGNYAFNVELKTYWLRSH